ncbi:MAG: glycosyltransferase family 4 protein [Cytophagaceae bacterium]|jgi:glycosyltransferase involved in cell wall biosynthesis|nr:glycosyltransferase family 4 protein [Cytophagaceae bacterium]
MKVLLLHNQYKISGGEDVQTMEELRLLKAHGISCDLFTVHNDEVETMHPLRLAANTIWSSRYYRKVYEMVKQGGYDVVHIQNFFPLLSPSIIYAIKKAGAKVVLTAHNYRLICPNALLFVDNQVCHSCVSKTLPYPAIVKKCYRDNTAASAVAASMLGVHNLMKTWSKLDAIICVSSFVQKQLSQAGFASVPLHVRYNHVAHTTLPESKLEDSEGYYLFVGRLSDQKGVPILLKAFSGSGRRLKIIGEGPMLSLVQQTISLHSTIEYLGKRSLEETHRYMAGARALIVPSMSHEPFGRTIVEAFAQGTPVLGSAMGGITELIEDGYNGFLFQPERIESLKGALDRFESVPEPAAMRANAKRRFIEEFNEEKSFRSLLSIYEQVCAKHSKIKHPSQQY